MPFWLVMLLAALAIWGMGIVLGCVLGSTWRERHPHPLSPWIDADDDIPTAADRYGRHARESSPLD